MTATPATVLLGGPTRGLASVARTRRARNWFLPLVLLAVAVAVLVLVMPSAFAPPAPAGTDVPGAGTPAGDVGDVPVPAQGPDPSHTGPLTA